MKKIIWLVGAMCAAAAGCLLLTSPRRIEPATDPTDDLAHRLEDAWRDHHTTV
jgi:HAMP domain-containing protein